MARRSRSWPQVDCGKGRHTRREGGACVSQRRQRITASTVPRSLFPFAAHPELLASDAVARESAL